MVAAAIGSDASAISNQGMVVFGDSPWAWAVNDSIHCEVDYEIAAGS